MKKLLFLLLFVPILFGCEPYQDITEPHLTGVDPWIFIDYDIIVTRSISSVTVIENDTICINSFGEQSIVSGGIIMKQHYKLTSPDRRFVKGVTQWEFDDNSYTLYVNNNTNIRYTVKFPNYMMKEYDKMCITNPSLADVTNYTFSTNAIGANYATKLQLLSPPIVSDLLLSNGMRDKAVTVQVLLTFMRN